MQEQKEKTDALNEKERRSGVYDRRRRVDRRLQQERREDRRIASFRRGWSLKNWFRSLTKLRLGVDRRKGVNRRQLRGCRRQDPAYVLTPEEISLLLKNQ